MSYTGSSKISDTASRRSLNDCNKSFVNMDSDEDTTEDGGGDDRDESKRKSRNLSEKKRRDQFNVLINELCSMVSTSPRKMDKSTVLKATISFLKSHNELACQSQVQETQENWKPSFLSNEEFTHLMLEALDGFITVITSSGSILYVSESITSLLGHLPSDLVNSTIYDYIPQAERSDLYNILLGSVDTDNNLPQHISHIVHFRLGGLEMNEENQTYQLVKLVGYFKRLLISPSECNNGSESATEKSDEQFSNDSNNNSYVLIATGRLLDSELLRDMSVVVDSAKNEFSSRHSLEWKFLFLDHRAPPIIGYLPFEVLGTSGYDYYHCDDLDKVSNCHEMLMQKGEGTSCYYRFLTKGQQWIWLQTRFYITYHQWNSKPEFIVCTHRVVSYADVMKELRGEIPTECTRLQAGPTVPKQAKIESKKSSSSSSSTTLFSKSSSKNKHLNGSMSYGSMNSKRNFYTRKLELPPKFTSAITSSHDYGAGSATQQPALQYAAIPSELNSSVSHVCAQPLNTVTVALHPQVPQFVQPTSINPVIQHAAAIPTAAMQIPLTSFDVNSLPHNPANFGVPATIPNLGTVPAAAAPFIQQGLLKASSIQDQLLLKHAQLQNQIIMQQEELRRVSEQLLMSQFGSLQADLLPPALTQAIPQQQHPYLHAHHNQQLTNVDNTAHLQGHSSLFQYQAPIKGYQPPPPSGHDGTI